MSPSTSDISTKSSRGKSTTKTKTKYIAGATQEPPQELPQELPPNHQVVEVEVMEVTVGDYKIYVKGDEHRAIAQVIARDTDIIFDESEVLPEVFTEVAGKAPRLNAFEVARLKAISAYHQATAPNSGLIDVNTLVEHPYNSEIYKKDESVDDLIRFLEAEDGQIFKIVINHQGQIVSGNRRVKAAREINRRCLEHGLPPKFQFVEAEVVNFSSLEGEVKYAILQNQSRIKSPETVAAEIGAILALGANSSVPEKRLTPEEVLENVRVLVGRNGVKAAKSSAFNAQEVFRQTAKYKDKKLKERIQTFASRRPNKARELVQAVPPAILGDIDREEYQSKLLDRINENPAESVERASKAVNLALAPTADQVTSSDQLIDMAIAAGDVPSDNRKTPKEIVSLVEEIFGEIDLDSFAMLTDPRWIPAKKVYTILDDAFSKPHVGNVFANPPYSRSSEVLALMASEIAFGNITRLFLILPAKVQSTKAYHKLVSDHSPLILQPSKRLSFEPGEALLRENPSARTKGNDDPSIVIIWSQDSKDYDSFYEACLGHGLIFKQYRPFNPYSLSAIFESLKWAVEYPDGDELVTCNVFGSKVELVSTFDGGDEFIGWRVKVGKTVLEQVIEDEDAAKAIAIMTAIKKLGKSDR